jgi:uncharacterized OB-fold protein
MLPAVTPTTEFFWTSPDGRLRMLRCSDCGFVTHPPGPVCRRCGSANVAPTELSGRGHVYTFTVNRQPWSERLTDPYVIAIIELADQPGLRILSNVVDCDPDAVEIGMPVEVTFATVEDVALPFFRPVP